MLLSLLAVPSIIIRTTLILSLALLGGTGVLIWRRKRARRRQEESPLDMEAYLEIWRQAYTTELTRLMQTQLRSGLSRYRPDDLGLGGSITELVLSVDDHQQTTFRVQTPVIHWTSTNTIRLEFLQAKRVEIGDAPLSNPPYKMGGMGIDQKKLCDWWCNFYGLDAPDYTDDEKPNGSEEPKD